MPTCALTPAEFSPDACESVSQVLARVGDKWSLLVIHALSQHETRFNELRRKLPSISQKVLTATLRGLERDGYVRRTVTAATPPQVSYALTPLGADVLGPVTALAMWALAHHPQIVAARQRFDAASEAPAVVPARH